MLDLLLEASGRLAGSTRAEEILPAMLDLSRRLIAAEAYAVWRLRPQAGEWEIACSCGLSETYPQVFAGVPAGGVHLEGPLQYADVQAAPELRSRHEVYRAEGIRSLLAVPLRIHGRTAGSIAFYYREPHCFSELELRMAAALANLSGAALGTAELLAGQERARAAAEQARRGAAFLAQAGTLLASSLDYQTTLTCVARLAVPHIADWCAVDMVADNGELESLAVAHSEPSKVEWARALQRRYPPDPAATSGPPNVIRTGTSELVPEVTDEMLTRAAVDDEHLRILRQVGFISYMCVPMVARGCTLGAITLVAAESGRRYSHEDLALAEELAHRAALAVESARVYAQARRESSALKVAISALRESEARFRRVVESDMIGISFSDLGGRVVDANQAFLRIVGYGRPDVAGGVLRADALTPPEYRARDEQAAAEARQRGVCSPFEKEYIRADGSRVPVLVGAATLDEHGLMVGFALDLSERKKTIQELRENSERLNLALEAGRMAIWDWDVRCGALQSMRHLEPILGLAAGGLSGTFQALLHAIHPEDRATFDAAVTRSLAEGGHFEVESRVVWPDGSVHWVLHKGQAFRDAEGRPARVIGLGMDITGRKRLEEQLRQSQKLESIGLLAGGVAHDFNNLLTGILGNASLAMDALAPGHPAQPLLDDVVLATERAADLTRQLLAYSGKGRFVIEPLDLSGLVREIGTLMQVTVPKLVELRMDLQPGLPPMEADSSQVQQIVMNLLINAAEATGERAGTVVVRTGMELLDQRRVRQEWPAEDLRPGRYVYLEVEDSGCGMDAETQARIFDPFFTTKFTGRGLGLAAVSGIMRSHHGAIRVRSAPERGSTFRALFPALAAAPAPKSESRPVPVDLCASGLVLVVDDEDMVRRTAETALRRFGFTVLTASNGRQGVEMFAQRAAEIVLVLLDMTMPVMGGAGAVREIKRLRPDVPVIASSGYSEMEAARRFRPQDLAGFIQKPYTAADLAAKVKSALHAHASRMRA